MIKRFFASALWLLENYPVNCPRETFAGWLLMCICKNNENSNAQKRELIERVLYFLELPERAHFEEKLCKFISSYNLSAKKRQRGIVQQEITHQVDWTLTYCENMINNPGRLTHFIANPIRKVFDRHLLFVLQKIAGELLENLEFFAALLDTDEYAPRIVRLRQVLPAGEELSAVPYDEHAAWKLRQHPEGRILAAEIEKWHFHCGCSMSKKLDPRQKMQLEELLQAIIGEDGQICFNENDLLEGIAIIQSAQALCSRSFSIKYCHLAAKKPAIELHRCLPDRSEQRVMISKNPDEFNKNDQTIAYRTIGNKPSGLQPDIIYKCSNISVHGEKQIFYLLGDAKNYEKSDFGPALYAMLHYLLAFSELLNLPPDFFNVLNQKQFLKISGSYKRIVLFFPEEKKENIARDHPIELVFSTDLAVLANFFTQAFDCCCNINSAAR